MLATMLMGYSQEGQNESPLIEVVYEVFSLDRAEAAASQRKTTGDAELYQVLLAGLKSGKVKQEKLLAIRGHSGEQVSTEHLSEFFYPTEFDPAELPNAIGIAVDAPALQKEDPPANEVIDALQTGLGWAEGNFPVTPSTGTSLEMEKLGDALEVEAFIMGPEAKRIGIRFTSEHVELAGMEAWGVGVAEAKMPIFARQRILSSSEVGAGTPTLMGTVSPPGGGLAKADEAEARKTVWSAFITARIVELEK